MRRVTRLFALADQLEARLSAAQRDADLPFLVFHVILIVNIAGFGPGHDELFHGFLAVLKPPLQRTQAAGRVLEVTERAFALDRPPQLLGASAFSTVPMNRSM